MISSPLSNSLSYPILFPSDLPDSARIVKVTRTFDPMSPAMIIDCSRNPALFLTGQQDQGCECQGRAITWIPSLGFRAPGPVVVDSKRFVVPTDVRHFGS